jgi:HK97 gp10 family phage protein
MSGVTIKLQGIGNAMQAFDELATEIGDKKAQSKVLIPAARQAMKPVLQQAQQNAPFETGALSLMLQVEARRPTNRDRRSKYITESDTVIAVVTTASGKKMKAMSEGKGLESTRRRLKKMGATAEQAASFMGFKSDARAIAQEFGSASNPPHPYLRPAIESQSQATVVRLADEIKKYIDKFKAKI